MSLRPNARTEVRRNRYKVTVDSDGARRRREDNMVEIRKSKREESLLKKRRQAFDPHQTNIFPDATVKTTFIENKVVILIHSILLFSIYACDCISTFSQLMLYLIENWLELQLLLCL